MGPAALLLAVLLFYWKISLTRQYDWGWGPDFATQVLPWFHEQARQWHRGEFPLWDPRLWCGQPFVGQAQPGAVYPLNWLLFAMPLAKDGSIKPGFLAAYFLAIHYMGALFAYWLCRDLGRSRAAAMFAGCAFSFGGFLGTRNWPQMINGAVWAPLAFLYYLRLRRGARPWPSAALCGAALGMSWLSGHHQIPLFVTLAVLACLGFDALRMPRRIAPAAAVLLISGCVGALQILPAREYGKLAIRWAGAPEGLRWDQPVPYSVHESYSLRPEQASGVILPSPEGTVDPFAGIAFVSVAALGVAMAWREPVVRLMTCLAAGAWVFALGGASFAHGLLYALAPLVEKARTPANAIHLFHLALAVLAAYGVDAIRRDPGHVWIGRAARVLVTLGAVLALALLVRGARPPDLDPRLGLSMLAAWLAAAALGWRYAPAALGFIMAMELASGTGALLAPRDDAGRMEWTARMRSQSAIRDYLKRQPGLFRVAAEKEKLEPNWNEWHGFDSPNGYLASATLNAVGLPWHVEAAERVVGTRYRIGAGPSGLHRTFVMDGENGLKLFDDPEAFPRAWAVHRASGYANAEALHRLFAERAAEFSTTAFFAGAAPSSAGCESKGSANVETHRGGFVSIRAAMPCDGWVILSDTHFPGWTASVDGRAAPILEVNGMMRAVAVPSGEHRVEMRYAPRSVYLGAALTALGLIAAAGLAWRDRKVPLYS